MPPSSLPLLVLMTLTSSVPSIASNGASKPSNLTGIIEHTSKCLYSAFSDHCLYQCFARTSLLFLLSANASGVGEAKSSLNETYPRASGWFSSHDQRACWRRRRRVAIFYYFVILLGYSTFVVGCFICWIFSCYLCWHDGRNILGQLTGAMPQAIQVTPEEREAIERASVFITNISSFSS